MTDRFAAKPLVAAIAGPTATGKTEAAVAVCEALGGEVISMDSMQIYKRLSIGTAKPSALETRGIPHHLLSFVEPGAAYSVADYQRDATAAMHSVLGKGKLPVFAGGTGLYLRAISHPLAFGAAGGGRSEARERLEAEAAMPGGPARLMARLCEVDPASAARLHGNNTRRVIRALEVYALTGEPLSARQTDWEAEPEQDFIIFALNWPREALYQRINARVDRMMQAGLVEEVRALLTEGVPRDSQAMQAIGYKEIVAMLDGVCTREDAVEAIKRNSRRYAKRQLTWFRRDPSARWVDLAAYEDASAMHEDLIARIRGYAME
ncbi:MAG: tRNA (adenosine(37)-N6)-dimethylallyltransferase MiaA [Firmicutes bacterium]|nr:tRNA (adenosine(37)-N6)-dimethylallyltransferase MiaA [Bacillota bacterium]